MDTARERHRRLVLRVNELFHNLEGEDYEDVHPEIFGREQRRWDRLLAAHLGDRPGPRTFVDVGAGTGFVGERLLPHLRAGDALVCADISAHMLEICVKRLGSAKDGLAVRGLKMSDERLSLPDASADIVTLNSVLHHIPDAARFLDELRRVLKPGGLLFIGHEPNSRFLTERPSLTTQALWLHKLAPRRIAASVLKRLGLYGSVVTAKADPLLEKVNGALNAEGLIEQPLSRADLSRLIDVHSPTAGGLRREEGFDPFTLFAPGIGLRLRQVETYNHLSKLSGRHGWLLPYEAVLARLFPRDGATFFLVAERG